MNQLNHIYYPFVNTAFLLQKSTGNIFRIVVVDSDKSQLAAMLRVGRGVVGAWLLRTNIEYREGGGGTGGVPEEGGRGVPGYRGEEGGDN